MTLYPEGEKKVIVIYGTPLCKPFGNWYFMPPLETQGKIFSGMCSRRFEPDGDSPLEVKSILLSHDAPYGCNGKNRNDPPVPFAYQHKSGDKERHKQRAGIYSLISIYLLVKKHTLLQQERSKYNK